MIVPLTDAQLKEIQKSYPKSQAETDQDLAIIRHWLNKQPHLPKTSKYFSTIYLMIIIDNFRLFNLNIISIVIFQMLIYNLIIIILI